LSFCEQHYTVIHNIFGVDCTAVFGAKKPSTTLQTISSK